MKNAQDNFDFTPTIDAIRPWMDSTHPDFANNTSGELSGGDKSKLTYALFSQLPDFVCDYLNQGDYQGSISYMQQVPTDPKQVLISVMGFADAAQRQVEKESGGWRFFEDFILTEEETKRSLEYIKGNPQLALTFCMLDDMTINYLNGFLSQIQWSEDMGFEGQYGQSNASHKLMQFIKKQLDERKQFLDELIVSFSLGFADDKCDINEETLSKQLCTVFRNKAMQSCPSYYNRNEVMQCPFQPVLGSLSRAVFKEDDNGVITLSNEKRQGAFLYFLYQKAQQILEEQTISQAVPQQMAVDHS